MGGAAEKKSIHSHLLTEIAKTGTHKKIRLRPLNNCWACVFCHAMRFTN